MAKAQAFALLFFVPPLSNLNLNDCNASLLYTKGSGCTLMFNGFVSLSFIPVKLHPLSCIASIGLLFTDTFIFTSLRVGLRRLKDVFRLEICLPPCHPLFRTGWLVFAVVSMDLVRFVFRSFVSTVSPERLLAVRSYF